ncbi:MULTISPECIES: glycosyltransferase [unclassified Bacillus (in: firmicutes)]|uniref:glycosyltransferase n=1 Tax=unclassified Bacillus (in: firmicutes) TaxID=185979 RepID=UPI0019135934|nr:MULTISPECIES: glycosyltransferase [unclassified Bacillus (in: firmicutes)]MBK5348374.1 glycosyltransferase [Bacillus sp. TH45]MBK5364728.1 glycosyltransferase [Bacillus sp. TH50]
MPRVAVLIPVYNDQEGLNRTLKSLENEVEERVDVVVVDDGSSIPMTTHSRISVHNIKLIRAEKNVGIEAALNMGVKYIQDEGYEFIARIDAGDEILQNRFFKQTNYFEENPDVVLLGSHVKHVNREGKEVFTEYVPTTAKEIEKMMHMNSCFPHPSVMFKTCILKDIGLYSTEYPAAEDYEFFFRISKKFSVSNIDEVLIKKEINPNSISLSKRKVQLKSRLRIQLNYFNPLLIKSYIGVLKSLLLLIVPNKLVMKIKAVKN